MKKILFSRTVWISILLASVILVAFVVPMLPEHMHKFVFNSGYTIINVSALFSLKNRDRRIVVLFFTVVLLEWGSAILNMEVINDISKGFDILFFVVVVIALIHQIASAKEVSRDVILGSIAGYLLLGIIFSLFMMVIIKNVPDAYSIPMITTDENNQAIISASPPLYYSYVTLSSLGYGDIVPIKPISRSLATIIAVTGQFYIAVIVAMLVGKFLAQRKPE